MRISVLFFILSSIVLLSGCTQYWYRPGTSFEQAQLDHQECFKGILEQNPANAMTSTEVQEMNNCMSQKGYSLVFGHQLPKSADRINPIGSPHWKLNGVAGIAKDKSYPLFEY